MSQGQVETATSGLTGGTPRDNRYGTRGELIVGGDAAAPLPVTATPATVGAGTAATAERVTLASDDPGVVSLQLLDDCIVADDAAFTPAVTKLTMAGFEFDNVAIDSVDEGDAGAARISANRNQLINIRDSAGNERGWNIDANSVGGVSLISGQSFITAAAGAVAANTPRVTLASDDPLVAVAGATSGAKVITDANGTIQQYLRGLVYRPGTGTQSNVAGSATDVTILAANTSRLGFSVYNDSAAILYLLLSNATSSATVFTIKMDPNGYAEFPFGYTGAVKGLWASATGSARVTEYT